MTILKIRKGITMIRKKYVIENVEIEGELYRAVDSKQQSQKFFVWINQLSREERKALKRYRNRILIHNNINDKLRHDEVSRDAEIISYALQRAKVDEPIIVFRRLAKDENNFMRQLEVGNKFTCKDFKGAHLNRNFRNHWLSRTPYMLILIPSQTHGAYINSVSKWAFWEKEFLIDKGQTFVLLEKRCFLGRNGYIVKVMQGST